MDTPASPPSVATSGVLCDDRAWTPSHREEVISALWFIVAGVAHLGDCSPWVFWLIIAKATFDSIESLVCAFREWRSEDSRGLSVKVKINEIHR